MNEVAGGASSSNKKKKTSPAVPKTKGRSSTGKKKEKPEPSPRSSPTATFPPAAAAAAPKLKIVHCNSATITTSATATEGRTGMTNFTVAMDSAGDSLLSSNGEFSLTRQMEEDSKSDFEAKCAFYKIKTKRKRRKLSAITEEDAAIPEQSPVSQPASSPNSSVQNLQLPLPKRGSPAANSTNVPNTAGITPTAKTPAQRTSKTPLTKDKSSSQKGKKKLSPGNPDKIHDVEMEQVSSMLELKLL